jgi:hypothetical protein
MRWSRWLRPVAFAVGGGLLAWGASLLIPDRYTSSAMIRLRVEAYSEADTINQAYQETVSRKTLKNVIERLNLYPEERERLPLEDVIEIMRKEGVTLDIRPDRQVQISFAYHDRGVAQAAADALIHEMALASDDYYRKDPAWGRLEITKAAGPGEASSAMAFWRPRRYVSQGSMMVRNRNAPAIDEEAAEKRAENLSQAALRREHLALLIEAKHLPYDPPDELRKDLRFDRIAKVFGIANVFTIKFTYPDAFVAQKTVSLLVDMLIDENVHMGPCVPPPALASPVSLLPGIPRLETNLFQPEIKGSPEKRPLADQPDACRDPSTPRWQGAIDILDTASLPADPDGPSRSILASFGVFLGLGLWATNFKKPAN